MKRPWFPMTRRSTGIRAPLKKYKGQPRRADRVGAQRAAIFMDADPNRGGRCNNCHSPPVMTNHSIVDIAPQDT